MSKTKNILFISHDANRAGAQLLLLDAMTYLASKGHKVYLLLIDDWGDVFSNCYDQFDIKVLPKPKKKKKLRTLLGINLDQESFIKKKYGGESIDLIYANTIATACIAPLVKQVLNVPLVSHIHELAFSISMYASQNDAIKLMLASDKIIACSNAVGNNLKEHFEELDEKVQTVHSFVDNDNLIKIANESDSSKIKSEFGFPKDKILIGGCGNAEWRKGVDVFVNIVKECQSTSIANNIHFVWIGMKKDGDYYEKIIFDIEKMGISNIISLIEPTPKAKEIINSLDIFLVSSREDPFPLVMLEAALCEKPILGFEQTGGCSEFTEENSGKLAPYLNIKAMSKLIADLVKNPEDRTKLGKNARQNVLQNYAYEQSMNAIERIILSI